MNTISVEAEIPASPNPASGSQAGLARPSFFLNLATLLSGQAACALLGIAAEICYARLLGPAGRGQVSLCMMAVAFGALLGGLGGEIPITIWSADSKKRRSEWIPAVMSWGLIGCLLSSAVWLLVYWRWHPPFLKGITGPLAAMVLVCVPVSILNGYLAAMLTGLERFRLRAGLSLVDQFAGLLAFLALVWVLGGNAQAAMFGNLLALLLGTALAGAVLRNPLRNAWNIKSARGKFGAALSLGLRGQFGNLVAFFNYRLDFFIVNYFLDTAQVGLYAMGVIVSEALWQIPQAAAVALTPRTARTIGEGATEFTCLVMRQVLLISAVSGIALAILSPLAIPLVFGTRFSGSVPVIWWILPGTIALSLGKVASADFAARSKPEYSSLFSFAAIVATVVLDLALIPRMGIRGAALASSIAYLLDSALLVATLKYQLGVNWSSLLVPASTDFAVYRQAWLRCKSWCKPAIASAVSGRWN